MSELDVQLAGKSLADYTNTQLRLALGAVLYTNTADMWKQYLNQLGYSGDLSQMLQKYYVEYSVPQNFRNYINAGAFIYSPQQLFTDGSKGVLYDNNDLSSFYLDAAGTTAATVNGLVGLQLDKSANLALGAELVTNGDFSGGTTGWTSGATFTSTAAVSSGEIQVTATAAFGRQVQQFATTAGKWYRATATMRRISGSGYAYLAIATSGEGDSVISATAQNATATPLTASLTFLATASTTKVCMACSSIGDVGGFDNVSVVELAGNHRYQSTTGSKPVLRGTPTGANLVTNGDFASNTTGWTANAAGSLSWVSGRMRITNIAANGGAIQGISTTIGGVYRLTATFTRSTINGWLSVTNNSNGSASFASMLMAASGTFVMYFTATATTTYIVPYVAAGVASDYIEIDDVEAKDVSAGQVTAPYGLQYDGVDDFMQTAAVDFTATDKACLIIGTRKLSDASTGVVASLGSVGVTNGSFEFRAPWTNATADIGMAMKGPSGTSSATYTTFTAPITNVFTFSMDFAGGNLTEIAARANGVALTASGLDTGASQFANQPLYFGRRTGTILPYTGLEYGMVICGKTLTSTQISQTERYIAQRTGVTI